MKLSYADNGLVVAIAQHHRSGQILMVGFANADAIAKATETGHAWFFSRSRQRLWEKGETSGNYLDIKGIRVDCDGDALIYLCEPHGPTCHTGAPSCFFNTLDGAEPGEETDGEAAFELWTTIDGRRTADPETSYVAKLLSQGVDRIGKKVGEEAAEVIIAAKNEDRAELAHEVADLWFHSLVLLAQQGMSPADVWAELRSRRRP